MQSLNGLIQVALRILVVLRYLVQLNPQGTVGSVYLKGLLVGGHYLLFLVVDFLVGLFDHFLETN